MKLLYYPDKKLFLKPENCSEGVDPELAAQMWDFMLAHGGVGLSAIQVGIPKAFFVARTLGTRWVWLNPQIVEASDETVIEPEGCLSAPGFYEKIKRFQTVTLEHGLPDDRKRETFSGFDARIIQHETEHCNGNMFSDHFTSARRSAMLGHIMKLKKMGKLR